MSKPPDTEPDTEPEAETTAEEPATEEPKRRVVTARNALGQPTEVIETSDLEAASHWDERAWRRL